MSIMRAPCARRLAAASAAGILMAGGAAIGTAGTAAAAVPAVPAHLNTNRCFHHDDWRCFDHGGFRFDHRGFCFNHPRACFDHHFGNRVVVIVVTR
ncbi:hypothetical protein GCM10010345_19960 [Streptomyces canarius]|uniref:Secreted protein n=2 Tax=Streptomyces TaxID=1883 RepID=A0ABQ3CI08_9ACTN|nr:hypothetical protein GCM10010345_19960 [Streptomyces canarius]